MLTTRNVAQSLAFFGHGPTIGGKMLTPFNVEIMTQKLSRTCQVLWCRGSLIGENDRKDGVTIVRLCPRDRLLLFSWRERSLSRRLSLAYTPSSRLSSRLARLLSFGISRKLPNARDSVRRDTLTWT
jgi:hypothetical protein